MFHAASFYSSICGQFRFFQKIPLFIIFIQLCCSEYDITKDIFTNSYPWLFPGGIGDIYDMTRGKVSIKEWGRHLLRYYDGCFLDDSLFGLFLYNTVQRHSTNSEGNFFLASDRFIERNPPTVQDLQRQIQQQNCRYIHMLRYFARNIKGSDNYWRSRTDDLEQWINHHVSRGHGPPTFFITLSCAENWWPDLRRLLYQLEKIAGNNEKADAIKIGGRTEMATSARKYPLFVNEFFMKRANSFMKSVMKNALQIDHYWGRVEFAPGRGAIHLHIVAIAKDRAYLQDFFKAKTLEDKAEVLNDYAIKHLDMTADANVIDNLDYHPDYSRSPLGTRFCSSCNEEKDVTQLAQDCMMHQCNRYCLKSNKIGTPRTCRSHYGTESEFGKVDTPGMVLIQNAKLQRDKKGITHFRMK
jgi:hypothetical protein